MFDILAHLGAPSRISLAGSLARKQAVNNDMRAKGLTDYAA
jgi:hypothetical protein